MISRTSKPRENAPEGQWSGGGIPEGGPVEPIPTEVELLKKDHLHSRIRCTEEENWPWKGCVSNVDPSFQAKQMANIPADLNSRASRIAGTFVWKIDRLISRIDGSLNACGIIRIASLFKALHVCPVGKIRIPIGWRLLNGQAQRSIWRTREQ